MATSQAKTGEMLLAGTHSSRDQTRLRVVRAQQSGLARTVAPVHTSVLRALHRGAPAQRLARDGPTQGAAHA